MNMMIEQNTGYANLIHSILDFLNYHYLEILNNPNYLGDREKALKNYNLKNIVQFHTAFFDEVFDVSKSYYDDLSKNNQEKLFNSLNRGMRIIDNENQMYSYFYSYGRMHKAKLYYAFNQLPESFLLHDEINIIDYGCGQAIGTLCYRDYIAQIFGNKQKIKNVVLIEPSEICLRRAALHASSFLPYSQIITVNKRFEDIVPEDIVCDADTPTLHIFSNVIDMPCFDTNRFASLLNQRLKGFNYFVCVSPKVRQSEEKMENFASLLHGEDMFCKSLEKNELHSDHEWTCSVCTFFVTTDPNFKFVENTDSVSTKLVGTDRSPHHIIDSDGVVYNRNKTRLLSHRHKAYHPYHYTLSGETIVIADYAFDNFGYKSIEIPNTVTHIGDYAFIDCALERINIPKGVVFIGKNPFCYYRHRRHSVKELSIESESCRFIANNGFLIDSHEKRLISYYGSQSIVSIPNTIKVIGDSAFSNCYTIQQVIIPESVERIESHAFYGCEQLQNIMIPDSVLYIGESAFEHCSSLQNVKLSSSLSVIKDCAFRGCSSITVTTIPNTVTQLGNSVFERCKSLKTIVLSNKIKIIGEHTFQECWDLQQITIPNSITEIGPSAFKECKSLKELYLPDSITTIGCCAFENCFFLEQITIPDSVTMIGSHAFKYCGITHINIPNSITIISWGAFSHSSLRQVCLPHGVTTIKDSAFNGCRDLQQIFIPDTVSFIGDYAFCDCWNLQQIIIPKGCMDAFKNLFEENLRDKLVEQ